MKTNRLLTITSIGVMSFVFAIQGWAKVRMEEPQGAGELVLIAPQNPHANAMAQRTIDQKKDKRSGEVLFASPLKTQVVVDKKEGVEVEVKGEKFKVRPAIEGKITLEIKERPVASMEVKDKDGHVLLTTSFSYFPEFPGADAPLTTFFYPEFFAEIHQVKATQSWSDGNPREGIHTWIYLSWLNNDKVNVAINLDRNDYNVNGRVIVGRPLLRERLVLTGGVLDRKSVGESQAMDISADVLLLPDGTKIPVKSIALGIEGTHDYVSISYWDDPSLPLEKQQIVKITFHKVAEGAGTEALTPFKDSKSFDHTVLFEAPIIVERIKGEEQD